MAIKIIKSNLKEIIEEKGITIKELSKISGIKIEELIRIEQNDNIEELKTIAILALASVLNKEVKDIVEYEEEG